MVKRVENTTKRKKQQARTIAYETLEKKMKCLTEKDLTKADKARIAKRRARGKSHPKTKEQKQAASKRMMEKWQNVAYRDQVTKALTGKVPSEEARKKMSQSHTGYKHDNLAKQTMSESQKARRDGEEISEETRFKMSEAQKARRARENEALS